MGQYLELKLGKSWILPPEIKPAEPVLHPKNQISYMLQRIWWGSVPSINIYIVVFTRKSFFMLCSLVLSLSCVLVLFHDPKLSGVFMFSFHRVYIVYYFVYAIYFP